MLSPFPSSITLHVVPHNLHDKVAMGQLLADRELLQADPEIGQTCLTQALLMLMPRMAQGSWNMTLKIR